VKARSIGLGYQLYKKAWKHQRLVAVAAVALLAVASALGWALHTRSHAAQREEFARRFTEKVERIESQIHFSALAPLHDTSKDRAALRERLGDIEKDIQRAGPLAAGPGYYALGRGYLEFGEEEKAREQLETAWNDGFREPRVAAALARVLSRLYRKERLEAERRAMMQRSGSQPGPQGSGAPLGRDKQKRAELYRELAKRYLGESRGAEEFSPALVEALVAFYDDKFDEALAQLEKMEDPEPWTYEALQLRGDIFRVRAAQRVGNGDFTGAREDFAAGRRAYAVAAEIGRSEFAIHLAQGELELTQMIMELYSLGEPQEHFLHGLEAVARARRIAPDSAEALLLEAHLYQRAAEHKAGQTVGQKRYEETRALLQKARALAEGVLKRDPKSSRAHLELGQEFALEGRILALEDMDPSGQLRQASMHFDQVDEVDEDQDAIVKVHAGLVFAAWAEYEIKKDGKPLPYLDKAIIAYDEAIQHDRTLRAAWLNLGKTYLKRESVLDNQDPDGDLKKAQEALAQAQALGPEDHVVYYYMGRFHERAAAQSQTRGADAREDWIKARTQYERALVISGKGAYLHDRLGLVWLELAREEWMRNGNPFPLLDRAQASYERAFAVNPEFFTALSNLSDVWVQRALYQRAQSKSPKASLRSALTTLASAGKALEKRSPFWTNLGTVHVLMADFEMEQGRDPSPSLLKAEEALKEALRLEKKDPQTWLYHGQLLGLQARWRAHQGRGQGQDEDFKKAAMAFQKAIGLATRTRDTRELEYRHAFCQFCREWASRKREVGGNSKEALGLCAETASCP
jgi:serine/threonine-protein kinase